MMERNVPGDINSGIKHESNPKHEKKPKLQGSKPCVDCGKTISANKDRCASCNSAIEAAA